MTNDPATSDGDQREPALSVTQLPGGVCVVEVGCELDMVTTPAFERLLTQEIGNHPVALVVDLTACEFMGSSGLAALVAARERAVETSTTLGLAGLNRTVRRSFEATSLDAVFTIYPDRDTALESISND